MSTDFAKRNPQPSCEVREIERQNILRLLMEAEERASSLDEMGMVDAIIDAVGFIRDLAPATPHRNYQYLSDFWCECGWHLGKAGVYNYCPDCGRMVEWG